MKFLLLLPVVGIVYAWCVRFFVRNFFAAWVCLLVANWLNFTFGMDRFVLAGLHISPLELLYLCLLPAGIIRTRFHELRISPVSLIVGGYLFLFCLSVGRGMALYGVATAGNESRGFVYQLLALVYFATVPHDLKLIKKLVIAQIAVSAAYLLVAVANYMGLPVGGSLGVTNEFVQLTETVDLDRALPAVPVASITLSLIMAASWAVYRKHNRRLPILVFLFTITIIFMQHRSVWFMLIGTFVGSAYIDARLCRYLLKMTAAVVVVGALSVAGISSLRTRIAQDLTQSATDSRTADWRVEVWKRSVGDMPSVLTFLIGQPMGSGYTRLDPNGGGYTVDIPPHDEFIDQYLRTGILGAVLSLLFLLRVIQRYLSSPNTGALLYPTPEAWVLVTLAVLIFAIPYSYTPDGIAMVAIAAAVIDEPLRLPRNTRKARRTPMPAATVAQIEGHALSTID